MDSTIFLWIVPFFLIKKSKAFLYRKSTFQLALHYKSFFVFSLTVLLLLCFASHFSCKTLPLVHAFWVFHGYISWPCFLLDYHKPNKKWLFIAIFVKGILPEKMVLSIGKSAKTVFRIYFQDIVSNVFGIIFPPKLKLLVGFSQKNHFGKPFCRR